MQNCEVKENAVSSLNEFNIGLPFRVVFGPNSMTRIGPLVKGLGQRAFVGCGRSAMREAGVLGRLESALGDAGLEVMIYDQIEPDPSTDTVDAGVTAAREFGADLFVGLGGGSVLDATKAIAFLTDTEGAAAEHLRTQNLPEKPCLPIVAIPTTSGTGSEATKVSVLTDSSNGVKRALYSVNAVARLAVLEPAITRLMPRDLTVETGLDALGHAVEGYLATSANPIAEAAAMKAIRLIARYLPVAAECGDDLAARGQMAIAAMLGGVSICAGVGVGHELAMAIGSFNHQPHGRLVGVLTPYCLEFNRASAVAKTAEIGRAMGFAERGTPDENASQQAVEGMFSFVEKLLPCRRLEPLDVATEDICDILEVSKLSTNIGTNPRELDDSLRGDLLRRCITG